MDKPKNTIRFNTGRAYTEEGQIVIATLLGFHSDEFGLFLKVKFEDTSRGITGIVNVLEFEQDAIMAAYDRGGYELA